MLRFRLLGVAALVVALIAWHPARVAGQALLLLPALFPNAPFDPLTALAPAPTRTEHSLPYAGGIVESVIFHPRLPGRHGALLLALGAGDLPRSDLAVHFAEALARLGVVVELHGTSGLLDEKLTFDEVDGLRVGVDLLASQPDVDPSRVGLLGLSASGGLSIVAAGQPDLRDRIGFVNSFGSYDDAERLLLDVTSRSIEVDGEVRPWEPEPRTVDVVSRALQGAMALPPEGMSRERARELIDGLPPEARTRLAQISPATYLRDLKARLYLMHDQDDPFIPFTESRRLAANAPPGLVERFTEFGIFSHVIPDRPVPWQTFLPDLWKLFWHVHAVLLEVL